jgi:hypothetical protein
VRLGTGPSGKLVSIGGTRESCSVHYVVYLDCDTVTASTASPVNVSFQRLRTATKSMAPWGKNS